MGFLKQVLQKVGQKSGQLVQSWLFDAQSAITTNPTCADINNDGKEEILFGTQNGILFCLNEEGKKLWEYNAKAELSATKALFMDTESVNSIYSQPIIINIHAQPLIIFGNEAGVLTALDSTGKKVWDFTAKGGIRGAPYAYDFNNDGEEEIIFGSRDKTLYVLTSKGTVLFTYQAHDQVESTPAVCRASKPFIVFGCNDFHIYAIDLEGKLLWDYKTEGKVHAQPAIGDLQNNGRQTIVIGSSDGHLYVLDEQGRLLWNYRTKGRILSQVMLADVDKDKDKELFFGACDDQIHALAPNSQAMWTYETGFRVAAPVFVTDIDGDNVVEVIAGSYDKNIYVLEATGSFSLDYMPGISGIVQQSGSYSDIATSAPGKLISKILYKYFADDNIISLGIHHSDNKNAIVAGTKGGKILYIHHTS